MIEVFTSTQPKDEHTGDYKMNFQWEEDGIWIIYTDPGVGKEKIFVPT